jgi:DNA polymerase
MREVTAERVAEMAKLEAEVQSCPLCDLCKTRKKAVPGEGPVDAEIMFIGEAPGYHENEQGRPFVGNAGRLLEQALASIKMERTQVYITNVVKCRPPENRDPEPQEIAACAPYLERQLALIQPKVVVTLGRFSMAKFFPGATISRIHGQAKQIGDNFYIPMFHPAAALRTPAVMTAFKADFLKIPELLEQARKARSAPQPGPKNEEEAPVQLGLFD